MPRPLISCGLAESPRLALVLAVPGPELRGGPGRPEEPGLPGGPGLARDMWVPAGVRRDKPAAARRGIPEA